MSTEEAPQWRAQIPADIDRPDPVIGGLSARQLLLLAPIILAAWAAFMLAKDTAPLWVIGVLLVPLLGAATAVAVGRRDGVGLDAYVLAALRWATAPKRRVGAPEGVPALPAWAPATRLESPLEPLRLPASAIGAGGVIDLGGQCAVMIACSSVNFHLASGREQDTAISAFAGVLHSLTGPAQILVRGLRLDLTPFTASLRAGALALAHPALEEAAHAHADFLDELGQSRLVQRHIVLVLTASGTPHTAGRNLLARAEDTASRLGGLGVQARLCDGETAEDILRACLHPSPEPPPPDHGADTERIST